MKEGTELVIEKAIGGSDLMSDLEIENAKSHLDYLTPTGEGGFEFGENIGTDPRGSEAQVFGIESENVRIGDDNSTFSGFSIGTLEDSEYQEEMVRAASNFGTDFENSMAEKSGYLCVQGEVNSRVIKSLKENHKELMTSLDKHSTLFDKIDKDVWQKESEFTSLKLELKALRKEVKETRKVVRKQSLSPPTVVTGNQGVTASSMAKFVDKELKVAMTRMERVLEDRMAEKMDQKAIEVGKFVAIASARAEKACYELSAFKEEVSSFLTRLTVLEGGVKSMATESDLFSGRNNGSEAVSELQEEFAKMEFEITLMKSRMGERSMHFGSIELPSQADTLLFVVDHMPVASYGCFFDFVALLDSLRDTQTTAAEYATQEHAAQKSKFLSTSEVSTSASFVHIAPLCFAGTKAESCGNYGTVEKSLPRVKDRLMWQDESGRFGLAKKLDREIQAKVNALEREIDANLGDSKGADLARKYLRASLKCWEKLLVWTEKFYQEMASVDQIDPSEAWILVLSCWMAFFEDLRDVRVACSGVSIGQSDLESNERKEVVARYIWTMGKAISVQNEYIEAEFNNHPTIVRVINYHMFHNKVPKQAYQNDMKDLEKKISDLFS